MQLGKILSGLALVSLCSTSLFAQSDTRDAGDDKITAKKIAGTWTVVKGKKMGEESNAEMLAAAPISISEEEFTIPSGAGEDFVMEYTIDNSQSPAHVDMTIVAGPAPESSAKGIIGMKDGKLMLCYNPMGEDRPEDFESTADNGFFMFVMERKAMDAEAIQGTWNFAKGMKAGAESTEDRLAGEVVITGESFTMPAGPDAQFVMAYELDTSASPVAIDFEITEGPVPEGTALGIIKMDGDNIVLCYDPNGAERPESFESTGDNGFFMFVLKPAPADD